MPRVCAQLAELTAQHATDAAQLARLIQSDPALAGEIMRVANSPALRPRAPIVSLQQAVSWLGVAEVRNIAMAVMLRGEVFTAPGHEPESEELWREAWLAGLWAKEIARERRKHVESAFLAALMHRTGAALALKILSGFESQQRTVMDAQDLRRSGGRIRAALRPPAHEQLAPAGRCAGRGERLARLPQVRVTAIWPAPCTRRICWPPTPCIRSCWTRSWCWRARCSSSSAYFPTIGARCWRSANKCAVWRACRCTARNFDLICLGSGPAGQKAAIQAAKAGFRACIIEREPQVGGSCLLSGTIPSKALREQALRYRRMRGSASSLAVELRGDAPLSALLHGVDAVIAAQDQYLLAQLQAQRRRIDSRQGQLFGRASHRGAAPGRLAPRSAVAARGARHRIAAAPCAGHRSGSRAHCRQRLDFEPAVYPALHAGARQRRHRLRICLHLRRAWVAR